MNQLPLAILYASFLSPRNVDPASTLQVVAELVKNGKYFEQMFLPGYSHNLGSDYITKRVFEFFWKNIKEK